jgi:hypothetical protein
VVQGDRFVRRLGCYSSNAKSITFEQNGRIKLPPGTPSFTAVLLARQMAWCCMPDPLQ